jgi:hypothetical protein
MAVSVADMERFAIGGDSVRFGDDIGNVIDIGDMNDDFGMGLSSNNISLAPQSQTRTINIDSYIPSSSSGQSSSSSSMGGGLGMADVSPLEPLEPIHLASTETINMNDFGGPAPQVSYTRESGYSNSQTATGPGIQLSSASRDPEAEKKEKGDFINKLQRLEQKGFPVSRKFTMDNSIEEIKTEYFRLVDARNLETSIKFQRQMLMGAITGMEWLNGRFDPFDLKLDGWSESVHENVEDFDEIFEELYDKYKDKGKMSPEMRLVMAVGGSGFMCHVSNTFFRSKMPSMDDVLRKNPELARQMAAAAAQQAGPGFGNFMGMAMGANQQQAPPPTYAGNGGGMPMGPNPTYSSPHMGNQPPMTQAGGFYAASGAPPAPMQAPSVVPTARREMTGPSGSGVDDILRTFEEVRRAEVMGASIPQPASGMSSGPAVAGVMSGAVSIHSHDDLMSQAESTRTGATSGRRRKRTLAPVGNTMELNV